MESNSEDDIEVDDETIKIFSDDWLGKPGVKSSSSESDSEPIIINLRPVKTKKLGKSLPEHIKFNEGDIKPFTCTICNCKFRGKKQISYHLYCASGQKPLKCGLCKKGFVKRSHLQYHLLTHTGEKPYKCSVCGKAFLQKDKVKRHERSHAGENDGKRFGDGRKTISKNCPKKRIVEKRFDCDNCGKSYADKRSLNVHKLSHQDIKNFVCEHCGKLFSRKNSLVVHCKIHFGVREFSCKKCQKAFKNKKDLRRHAHTHNDNLSYQCQLCKVKFRRKDNLNRHMRSNHPQSVGGNGTLATTTRTEDNPPPRTVPVSVITHTNRLRTESVIKSI